MEFEFWSAWDEYFMQPLSALVGLNLAKQETGHKSRLASET